jgi:glycosyltransferase involved in cell wall biosynthesis
MAERGRRISGERLNRIIWELGHYYPVPLLADQISISMVRPQLGYTCWNVSGESVAVLRQQAGDGFRNARMVVRLYDVTDIIFDGNNAHAFFDIEVGGNNGSHYFPVNRTGRNYIAEIGLRSGGGLFHPFGRSGAAFFDRDRPSGNYQVGGLFVARRMERMFSVENIFDAPVYEKMNRELMGIERSALSVAVVFPSGNGVTGLEEPLGSFIDCLSGRFEKFGGAVWGFSARGQQPKAVSKSSFLRKMKVNSETLTGEICKAHAERPFHLIHCHDWGSSVAGTRAAKRLRIPIIFSLHSTEYERQQGNEMSELSNAICTLEKEAVQAAALVIVPHSSTRQQVINLYAAPPEKVVIIPDILHDGSRMVQGASEVMGRFWLDPGAPTVLFSGEISHASGADILVEALGTVSRNHKSVQFVFAGAGPLKGELESRIHQMGVSHRCRFLGDVTKETFEALLLASDFVVIPARTWQDEGLAQLAISVGRPVLTTRQAGINCVVHGQNGLVTFDNPGSIVWGIQELLFNPLQGNMMRVAARKKANEAPTIESIAVQHYTYYGMIAKSGPGDSSA